MSITPATAAAHSNAGRPFAKFAKVYRRKGWAQKIASQLGGQIVAVADKIDVSD